MSKQETILIADDAEINRAVLRGLFEDDYNLLEAENGEQAMLLLDQYSEGITVVLLDLIMPMKSGYEVLEEMRGKGLLYHVPVVVVTTENNPDSRGRVFDLGATDIIPKPVEPSVVKSRVRNIIELGRYRRHLEAMVEEQSDKVRESNAAVIDMLSSVIEHRSLETGQHNRRIRMFTKILLEDVARNYQEYNLDDRKIQLITSASSMHDIGKIAIPDRILNKPGKLTPDEFEIMKEHTLKGCEILLGLDRLQDREYLQYAYQICRYHHERWDGSGYPDGLKENSIPICAQVVSIADCYDALTTDRVYKKAVPQSRAFSMILNGECGAFSPRLLECFKNVKESFEQLSREYGDGLPAATERQEEASEEVPLWDMADNTLEQSQRNYFALLRYMDSTVMEADLNTGVYHLVYLADDDFAGLRCGGSFGESIRTFAADSVHPDDRNELLDLPEASIRRFLDEGLTRKETVCRVLDRRRGEYVRCSVTLLRANLENPRLRKVLIIWRKENKEAFPAAGKTCGRTENSGLMVEKILGGVQKFRCDSCFTILRAGRGLIDLIGYTEKEIEVQFGNRYIDLVLESDRDKMKEQFRIQRNAGRVIELEYRLLTKEGKAVWVSDRSIVEEEDGEEVIYGILLDVTRSRRTEEELRLSLERHHIIMDQTNDIIFEWDIDRDVLYLSSNWKKKFGYEPITGHVREAFARASHLHPDDLPVLMDMIEAMNAGVPYKESEFRIVDTEGSYRWQRARASAQFDLDGRPFKAVGVLVDIDSQKKASDELRERVARDSLTGLYHKAAARKIVEKRLLSASPAETCAMLLLDVDNFKEVNDRYGHMFGDAVLVEVAEKITGVFRGADIAARVGGDEFMIFMPDTGRQEAERRAKELLELLRELFRENLGEEAFSCSIGLSFSEGSADFQGLFNEADRALYSAEAKGRGRCECYQEEAGEKTPVSLSEKLPVHRTQIDSEQSGQWNLPALILHTFDILYEAADFSQAIQSILELVGETFNASRVYIFETGAEEKTVDNTFEWCAKGVAPQRDALQGVDYVIDGRDYRDNFGDDGLFYCQDIRKLAEWQRSELERQNILSVLQYAIRDGGEFYGFVGFDDCKIRRLWTREQIDALVFVGKLLAVFLQKKRAQEALTKSVANLQSVLDHQDVWLYVLDPENYALRYANRKTKELAPEAQAGRKCYEVFFHRDSPCDNCVMEKADLRGQSTMEIHNPFYHLWLLTDAAIVEWDERRACLISCRDISAYKEAELKGEHLEDP